MNDFHRALIIADLEGIYDVYALDDMNQCQKAYCDELLVYIDALLEYGIQNIVVCDAHNKGTLLYELLEVYERKNVDVVSTIAGINFDQKYDYAFLVGFHGMAYSCGIIPHSFRFNFKQVSVFYEKLNEYIPIGEVEVYMRWLGAKGIPVLLVSGDREAVYEASFFNPYRETCCVKSFFEFKKLSRDFVFQKIRGSIIQALQLDYNSCLSIDQGNVCISFVHDDTLAALSHYEYIITDEGLIFNNCTDFVENLYPLVNRLIEFDKYLMKINRDFLQELRNQTGSLNRTAFEASEAGRLLSHHTLYSLNQKVRGEIKAFLGI